jgi:hypothetical protein
VEIGHVEPDHLCSSQACTEEHRQQGTVTSCGRGSQHGGDVGLTQRSVRTSDDRLRRLEGCSDYIARETMHAQRATPREEGAERSQCLRL